MPRGACFQGRPFLGTVLEPRIRIYFASRFDTGCLACASKVRYGEAEAGECQIREAVMAAPTVRDSVRFFYVKSQQFRVIHVDGAIGGG
jgi:hypothetical protein